MTENEAVEVLKDFGKQVSVKADGAYQSTIGKKACDVAINALEEVQKYRAIGTPEECRSAMEKQSAKKVISFDYNNGTVNYGCPVCKRKIISKIDGKWCGGTFNEYCDRCGQKLDWSDDDETD